MDRYSVSRGSRGAVERRRARGRDALGSHSRRLWSSHTSPPPLRRTVVLALPLLPTVATALAAGVFAASGVSAGARGESVAASAGRRGGGGGGGRTHRWTTAGQSSGRRWPAAGRLDQPEQGRRWCWLLLRPGRPAGRRRRTRRRRREEGALLGRRAWAAWRRGSRTCWARCWTSWPGSKRSERGAVEGESRRGTDDEDESDQSWLGPSLLSTSPC